MSKPKYLEYGEEDFEEKVEEPQVNAVKLEASQE